jgi:hypothetical protein
MGTISVKDLYTDRRPRMSLCLQLPQCRSGHGTPVVNQQIFEYQYRHVHCHRCSENFLCTPVSLPCVLLVFTEADGLQGRSMLEKAMQEWFEGGAKDQVCAVGARGHGQVEALSRMIYFGFMSVVMHWIPNQKSD